MHFTSPLPVTLLRVHIFSLISDSAAYAHYVFNAFDQDHSGSISFEEFVMGLSLLARGSLHDKLQWAFNLYDVNGKTYTLVTIKIFLEISRESSFGSEMFGNQM